MNRQLTGAPNLSLVRSADHDSQDRNLVGLLDQFAKSAGSYDSVDSILTTPTCLLTHPYLVLMLISTAVE